ncbi:hypothetical protein RM553_03135 [Zunongwangia sp. F363]|uniref:WYL domain-containing protein n=1 Tax=Autumnicola tepida TaxID=3075595 RepID=A0ABU3C6B4_9FLAO|nr:hypothetical protein [Zunongwangia sp. F363]MDT0641818.1 hypothetical protein [Zunongwangia sp. F363]
MNKAIVNAIENGNLLEFTYHEHYRLVEPHRYGMFKSGNQILLAYQIKGTGEKSEIPGWKMFRVAEIKNLKISNSGFTGTRPGYETGKTDMELIYAELS